MQGSVMSMPEGLEHTTCNICGSDDYALYHEQQDLRYRDTPRGTFQLVQCHKCGLLYLNPRPSEAVIGDYYPPDFYSGRPRGDNSPRSARQKIRAFFDLSKRRKAWALREKTRIVARQCNIKGHLLDVGCAAGDFLDRARSEGWAVEGVDISEEMCEFVQHRLNISCHHGPIQHVDLPAESYDAVTFWASMEHLHDPKGALEATRRMLKKKGIVVVLVPNADSLEERWLKNADPNPIDIPRHLHHFSVTSMTRLLEMTGFRIKYVKHFTPNAADRFTVVLMASINKSGISGTPFGNAVRLLLENVAIVIGDLIGWVCSLSGRSHTFIIVGERDG